MRRGLTGRMVVASGLLAVVVGTAFVVLLLAITSLRGATDLRQDTREELVAADALEKLVLDIEIGLRGFVLTGEERFLEPTRAARAAFPPAVNKLERLATDDSTDLARVRRIVEAATSYIEEYADPLIASVRRGDPSARSVETTDAGKRRVDALRATFGRFREAVRARLSSREVDANAAANRATVAAAIGIGGSVLLILLFTGYLTRVIVQPIRRLARMADQLASGDLTARMREGGIGEIRTLEHSFNEMAGSLESSRDDLSGLFAEQAALRRVATLVAQGVPPEQVFAAVTEEVVRVLPVDVARMGRYEPDDAVTFVAASGMTADLFAVGARVILGGENVSTRVARTGRPARIDSYADASGSIGAAVRESSFRSAVGTPIMVEGRTWGVMVVGSSLTEPMPADIEARLATFTELLATAVANAESRGGLARLAEEQVALRRVATLVASGVTPENVFAAVAKEVGQLLPVTNAALHRYDPDEMFTTVAAWTTGTVAFPVGKRWNPEGKNLTTLVLETGGPARIDDFADGSGPIGIAAREAGYRSGVGTPIIVEGRLWGVMTVGSSAEEPLLPDTEERLASFTELVATAIANTESSAALGRLVEQQAALRRVATLVARGVPAEELFAAVAEEVGQLLPVTSSAMGRYDPDGMFTTVAAWSAGAIAFPVGKRWIPEGKNVTAMVCATGRPARIDDFADASGAVGDAAREAGYRSAVGSPIIVEDCLWGIVSAASTAEEPLPADTEERLAAFTDLVGTAIANTASRAELTASRARVVAASDEARRRIERDLHDGAQQQMVSLVLELRGAAQRPPSEIDELRGDLSRIAEDLVSVLDSLREISRGIHPAILAKGGLGPALKALARRSPIPVEVDVRTATRLPEPIEVAAYYVASEALTNAVRHAQASKVSVELDTRDSILQLAIRDDGIGGADLNQGSGLVGLRDRTAAVGGTLQVTSPSGKGTTLLAELPLDGESSASASES